MMNYAILDLSVSLEPEYCFISTVDGGRGAELLIARGESAMALYPSVTEDVLVHLDDRRRGLKLASRLGNTRRLLILSEAALATLTAELDFGRFEVHPFLLINHKGRIHSRDYLFVNPLEQRAIAHPSAQFDIFESTGRICDCERWVLESSALAGAPDLLRSAEFPYEYFVSERFRAAARGLTNFAFVEVEHR